jgi:uncharacterized membrane protein
MVLKKALQIIMILFYILAGYNHFANPAFYYPIIPSYLSEWSRNVNILSGIAEILFAILLIPIATRKLGAWGILSCCSHSYQAMFILFRKDISNWVH